MDEICESYLAVRSGACFDHLVLSIVVPKFESVDKILSVTVHMKYYDCARWFQLLRFG